jgi:hypothetical protein
MSQQLLREAIDVLRDIRMEIHGVAEDSVISQLDKVIDHLEADLISGRCHRINAKDLLVMLGWILESLPEFAKILDRVIKHLTN